MQRLISAYAKKRRLAPEVFVFEKVNLLGFYISP